MANLNKNVIPSAISRRTKLDLSFDHFTTQTFMQAQPVGYRHMIMGEKIDIEAIGTVRAAPMPVPTYGRMRVNLRAFWCPYRLVFPQWDSFYTDSLASDASSTSLVDGVPYFTNRDFVEFLRLHSEDSAFAYLVEVTDPAIIDAGAYDLQFGIAYFKFTPRGHSVMKIMHSLGYRINYNIKNLVTYNALALLAWARVYVDWYANQNYLDSRFVSLVNQACAYNNPNVAAHFSAADLEILLNNTFTVCYNDNNYFLGAYDAPTSPNPGLTSQFIFDDVTNRGSAPNIVHTMQDGTPIMVQQENTNVAIGTQYIHDALKMLTDYQKRHQLASALPISRWLAQFGAVPTFAKLKRSTYIGCKSFDVNSGAVFSTASPDDGLADYGGHAESHGSGNWSFTADEFGILIIISSVLPSGGYWQGCDRHNYAMDKFDFFVPEADGLSVQAVYPSEVFLPNTDMMLNQHLLDEHVFGYVGRYAHYKRPLDFVSGGYEMPSQMLGGDSWHLLRTFDVKNFANNAENIHHSLDFTIGSDAAQYLRIFNYQLPDIDPFMSQYHFNIVSYAPCRPMNEQYEFEDNGDKVTIDNGAIVN